jgi:hypothetical protein
MKVRVLIENDKTQKIEYQENYDILSRDKFREMIYKIEDIKDDIENDIDDYCTIVLSFNWNEAEELEITEEDCDI